MDKRQKSDHQLVRRSRSNSAEKKIGIVEDEDYAIAIGRRSSTGSSGSALERKASSIQLVENDKEKDNVKVVFPDQTSYKLDKEESKKLMKLLKILKKELKVKQSTKLHIYDKLENLFRKGIRSKSLKSSELDESKFIL